VNVDINNAESIAAALAQMKQKAEPSVTAVTEPTVTQAAIAVMEPENIQATFDVEPGPLTEKEAISVVQSWVTQDAEVELSERRSFEEMVSDLQDAAEVRTTNISLSRFEEIVKQYAPDAPHRNETPRKDEPNNSYPAELESLVKSGVATFEDGYWLVNRCEKCGQFRNECCGRVLAVAAVRQDEKTLTAFGRQAVGLDPIKPPKQPKTLEEIQQDKIQNLPENPWWNSFRGVDELQGNGTVKMYIENFLPEGATLICGLPKEGKSFLALSVAKALTSGQPLFGRRGFEVSEIVPVLYLAAESGDGALKLRCKKMGITNDKTRFICRTLSQGLMLGLDDPQIEALVKDMRPIVILETLIRFNDGKDEDDASENRKLAQAIFHLIALGARAVIGIHHSRKDLNKANPSKEAAVRGSGDGLAMVDAVWLVMQDERLYQHGKGANEIDVVGWGRDFNPMPMRLALTKKAAKDGPAGTITYAPGVISCIDAGDFEWVDKRRVQARRQELTQTVEQLLTENPSMVLKGPGGLIAKTGHTEWEVRKALKSLSYSRARGGKMGVTTWTRAKSKKEHGVSA
jgi:hypothetical protein